MSRLIAAITGFLRRQDWTARTPPQSKFDPKAEKEAADYSLIFFLGVPLVPTLIVAAIFLVQHLQRQLVPVVGLRPLCVVLGQRDLRMLTTERYVECGLAPAEAAKIRPSGRDHVRAAVAEAAEATIRVDIDGAVYDRRVFIHGADLDRARSEGNLWINRVRRKTQKIVVANDWDRVLMPFDWLRGPILWVIVAWAMVWGFGKLRAILGGRAGAE